MGKKISCSAILVDSCLIVKMIKISDFTHELSMLHKEKSTGNVERIKQNRLLGLNLVQNTSLFIFFSDPLA